MADDFFGNEQTARSDLPRYAISEEGKKGALQKIQGVYEGTIAIEVKGKQRLLHQVQVAKSEPPIEATKDNRIFIWGNYDMDQTLPTLPAGCKMRITYTGKEEIGGGHTLKRTPVEFPANTVKRANPFKVAAKDEPVPF